jgi:hypothetical protein
LSKREQLLDLLSRHLCDGNSEGLGRIVELDREGTEKRLNQLADEIMQLAVSPVESR